MRRQSEKPDHSSTLFAMVIVAASVAAVLGQLTVAWSLG